MNSQTAIAATPPGRATLAHALSAERLQPFSVAPLVCAAITFFIGAAVLLGWAVGSEALMIVSPGHASMKPNSALCFLVIAIGLAIQHKRTFAAHVAARCAGVVAIAICSLTLFEYIAKIDLHIDQLLFSDTVTIVFPGRMAQITAANFCLAGAALLLLTGGPRARRLSQALALVVSVLAFAAMVGYLYGVPVLYGSFSYTSMALHTGVVFLILGAGLLLAPQDSALGHLLSAPERGSWLVRRLLPAALLLPALLGWLYLRPSLSFGNPVFAMALFAVTLAAMGTATLWQIARFLNREQRQLAEIGQLRENSAATVRQSEQELRLITDHLPTLISYIDASGRFIRVNRTYELWMGLPAGAIVGRTIRELLGEAYWASTLSARSRVLKGETVTFEVDYPTINGERHVQVTYAPDHREDGRLRGMACLVLDMHDRHLAEAALRQSEKLAAVGRMASSIAHEINNPLEAVTNLLYLAEQDTAGHASAGPYIAQAQTELARVTHIVTQTLRFHRQSTSPVWCRVSDLIAQVLVLYQGRLSQGHIAVESRFRDTGPILCRDGEVRQALANLIGNAADAMAASNRGSGTAHAPRRLILRSTTLTDARTGRPGVSVTVADTGHGISAATRSRLFEPFHTTKGATGSGLGLWISKEIIDRHDGRLTIRSSVRPDRSGTVFRIFLTDLPAEPKSNPNDAQ